MSALNALDMPDWKRTWPGFLLCGPKTGRPPSAVRRPATSD
ncbi:MAG: hypothetical protein ACRDNL_21270 [Spirillospora sp.]